MEKICKMCKVLFLGIFIVNNAFAQQLTARASDPIEKNEILSAKEVKQLEKEIKSLTRNAQALALKVRNAEFGPGDQDEQQESENPFEKKKVISKSYSVDAKDKLSINNQHGEVKIELWSKNEIKVDVTITGYANSEKKAQELINGVDIKEQRDGDMISLKTLIESENGGNWGGNWNWSWKSRGDEKSNGKRGVEINYMIYMPKTNALIVANRYGSTKIPTFSAPLKISSNYGSFTCDKLSGGDKNIQVQYGSGNIKQMDDGVLNVAYSSLGIDKADNLHLTNNYGSMNLHDVNNLDANIQYSSGKIGVIRESGKIYISYSDGVQLTEMPKTLKSLDIKSNYTSVKLPVNGDCNADFDVTINYANFRIPEGKATFSVNSDNDSDENGKMGWKSTKIYKGKIGKGAGTKIVIRSNYGGVKFTDN